MKKHKNLQTVKEHFNYFSSKNLKIVIKHIALNPAGVVQHGLIAWRCAPLRVLFIGTSFYSISNIY